MELLVLIEPLPDRSGYSARLGGPFDLTAQAPTAEEARQQLAVLVQRRLEQGAELQPIRVSAPPSVVANGGWLPNDDLTREWLDNIQQYREECDREDRHRLLDEPADGKAAS